MTEWLDVRKQYSSLPTIRASYSFFEKLPEYSMTLPTGVVINKTWRACRAGLWIVGRYTRWLTPEEPDYLPGHRVAWIEWYRPIITQKMGRRVVDHMERPLVVA